MKELEKKYQECSEKPTPGFLRLPIWSLIVLVVFVIGIGVGLYLGCVRWGPCGG